MTSRYVPELSAVLTGTVGKPFPMQLSGRRHHVNGPQVTSQSIKKEDIWQSRIGTKRRYLRRDQNVHLTNVVVVLVMSP